MILMIYSLICVYVRCMHNVLTIYDVKAMNVLLKH
jgi:hypothetical protein